MIQLGLSLGMSRRASGQEAPPSPFLAQPREFTRDRAIFDSGAQLGRAVADIPLSGTTDAPDGTVIEARAVSVDDGGAQTTGWMAIATAAAGTFAGTLPVPRSDSWFAAEIRVSGGVPARMVNRFGAGHIWAIWEQSNWERLLDYNSTLGGQRSAVSHPGDVQIVKRNGPANAVIFEIGTDFGNDITPSLIDFANAFSSVRPGEKLRVLWQTQSGTSPEDALTTPEEDAVYKTSGDRSWLADKAIHDLGTADGQQVGLVSVNGWIAWNAGAANTPNKTQRLFLGHGLDGTPSAPADYPMPRLMGVEHGGIYDWRYSRLAWIGPHGRTAHAVGAIPASGIAAFSDYGLPNASDTGYDSMITALKTSFGNAANPETLAFVGPTTGADRGVTDRAHMDSGPDGRQRLARIGMFNTLKTLGLIDVPIPVLDYRHDEPSGAYTDFGIIGFSVTTERRRRAAAGTLGAMPAEIPSLSAYGAAIPAADDHRTEVMGFTINGMPAKRVEIVEGAGPGGEDIARVWPNNGSFTYADAIRYGEGGIPGYLVDEDYADGVWANWLVADMGQPDAILPALPVHHQGAEGLPGTLATPDQFTVSGNTAFTSNAIGTIGNGRSVVRFEVRGRYDNTGGRQGIAGIHVTNSEIFRLNDGSLTLVTPKGNVSTPAGAVVPNVTCTVVAVCDLTADLAYIEVNGQRVAEAAGTLGLSGAFQAGRPAMFLQRSNGERASGSFESLRMWFNDAAGAGSPYKLIEGRAETVNADPWKVGDDAR